MISGSCNRRDGDRESSMLPSPVCQNIFLTRGCRYCWRAGLCVNIIIYSKTYTKLLAVLILWVKWIHVGGWKKYCLKGTAIFCFWFFYESVYPASEYPLRTVSNFFENSGRYLQIKVHHPYQRHQRQICHWYRRYRRQILPPVGLVLLTQAANFPLVLMTVANNWSILSVCCVHWSREHLKLFTILSAPPSPPPLQGRDSMYRMNQLI